MANSAFTKEFGGNVAEPRHLIIPVNQESPSYNKHYLDLNDGVKNYTDTPGVSTIFYLKISQQPVEFACPQGMILHTYNDRVVEKGKRLLQITYRHANA